MAFIKKIQETESRLEAAKAAAARASQRAARLASSYNADLRKLQATRKIALGAAVLRAVEADPSCLPTLRAVLLPHITRQADIDALYGTPFQDEVLA